MTEKEYAEYTQEGEKEAIEAEKKSEEEKKEEPSIMRKLGEMTGKAVGGIKKGISKVKTKAQEFKEKRETKKEQEESKKETIDKINKFDDKKITPSAKKKLIKAVEEGKITTEKAVKIKGFIPKKK